MKKSLILILSVFLIFIMTGVFAHAQVRSSRAKQLNMQYKKDQQRLLILKAKKKQLEADHSKLRAEVLALNAEIRALHDKLNFLAAQVRDDRIILDDMMRRLNSFRRMVVVLEGKIKQLKGADGEPDNESDKRQLARTEQRLAATKKSIKLLQDQINTQTAKLAAAEKEHQRLTVLLRKTIAKKNKTHQAMVAKTLELAKVNREIKALEEKLKKMKSLTRKN